MFEHERKLTRIDLSQSHTCSLLSSHIPIFHILTNMIHSLLKTKNQICHRTFCLIESQVNEISFFIKKETDSNVHQLGAIIAESNQKVII